MKPEISMILVWECKNALNQLAELNNVALIWVSRQCPALAGIRLQTFKSALLEPEETKSLSAGDILGFLRRSGIES